MDLETVTFHLTPEQKRALDAIAADLDCDRSEVLSRAIAYYLDLHDWQVRHIQQGLQEADAGQFVPESEVQAFLEKTRSDR